MAGILEQLRDKTAGLLFCDIDNFKHINDTYGHTVGDEVLKAAAARAEHILRTDDVIARLGGDEFVVVLPVVSDMAGAVTVAQKIRGAVCEPLKINGEHVHITLSVGIALAGPGTKMDADRLLNHADSALYKAKGSGRDRIATSVDGTITIIDA